MSTLIHDLILETAKRSPDSSALVYQRQVLPYGALADQVTHFAQGLLRIGLGKSERVAIYLEKRFETVVSMFGAAAAGGVYVPVNPLLKGEQVGYILQDCNVRVLVTSHDRLPALGSSLDLCPDLQTIIVVGMKPDTSLPQKIQSVDWDAFLAENGSRVSHRVID